MNRVGCAAVIAAVLGIACGSNTEEASNAGLEAAAPATASSSTAQEAESAGRVAFVVGGDTKTFDHLPTAANTYTRLASTIRAMPAADAVEQLSITFMSIDLREQQYPTELPAPRGGGQGVDPFAAMANVGLSYIDDSGQEWAGPAQVHVESFGSDGVITGSFSNVQLPHTDKSLPDATLTDGSFEARISAPW